MREFKFIRGIYKNETVLNQDETRDTLFALYGDGSPVSLDIKNDETFQKTIADLEPDNREIYTIRPNQFKVKATRQPDRNYAFEYDLDGDVYDNSMKFPDDVKKAAENHLSKNTAANISGDPNLILPGDNRKPTLVNFKFNNAQSFVKELYFDVSGEVGEYSIAIADGRVITAYKKTKDTINFNDKLDNKMFYNGKLQELIEPTVIDIAPAAITVDSENYNKLYVASKYNSADGFKFVHNNNLTSTISYDDELNFDLYEFFNGQYLTQVDASEAVSVILGGWQLNNRYVAYPADDCPSQNCYYEDASMSKSAYKYSPDNCIDNILPTTDLINYTFYKVNNGPAYIKIGECIVKDRGNIIVNGYDTSYKNLFIVANGKLQQIKDTNLNGEKAYVYTKETEKEYHIINNGVYINDSKNDNDYVSLTFIKKDDISNSNTTVSGKDVAPIQSDNTFRQIVENTLKIIATE